MNQDNLNIILEDEFSADESLTETASSAPPLSCPIGYEINNVSTTENNVNQLISLVIDDENIQSTTHTGYPTYTGYQGPINPIYNLETSIFSPPSNSEVNNYFSSVNSTENWTESSLSFSPQVCTLSPYITNNYIVSNNCVNSESSNEEEQTTDYNNEDECIIEENTNTLHNIGVPSLNLENISNIDMSSNDITITETDPNSIGTSNQYSMLYNDDVNNPFYKCNLDNLDYETDEEESKESDIKSYRVMYFWNYEFNYDYFSLNDIYIFNNKTELFRSKLNELKSIRDANNSNSTGNVIKIESNNNLSNLVNLYLIAYYDNAKTNIEFYGIFNQEIDEDKIIENIKLESIYGKKGEVNPNLITNLGENDFIVLHRKVRIV